MPIFLSMSHFNDSFCACLSSCRFYFLPFIFIISKRLIINVLHIFCLLNLLFNRNILPIVHLSLFLDWNRFGTPKQTCNTSPLLLLIINIGLISTLSYFLNLYNSYFLTNLFSFCNRFCFCNRHCYIIILSWHFITFLFITRILFRNHLRYGIVM